MADKKEDLYRLVDLGLQFMNAVQNTHGDARIMLGLGYYREDWESSLKNLESLQDRAEKAKSAAEAESLDDAIALHSLRLVNIFAFAATQALGERDAFIFLPAEARNEETAQAYGRNNVQHMARLCRRSIQ